MSMTEDELLPETLQKLGLRPDSDVQSTESSNSIEEEFLETRGGGGGSSGSLSSSSTVAHTNPTIPGCHLQMNPFYSKDLQLYQSTSDEEENVVIPNSDSLVNNPLQQNHWLFLFKDTPSTAQRPTCGYCSPEASSASTSADAIEEVVPPNCNCANNKNLFRRKENSLDEIFHRKKTLFRTCLEKADRKWTFFNAKPSHVIINRRFKSNLRSTLLREPILKLNKLEIEFREDTLTRRLTFSEIQTRYRTGNPLRSSHSSEDIFDLQSLNSQRILLEGSKSRLLPICSASTTTTDGLGAIGGAAGPSSSTLAGAGSSNGTGNGQQLATCSQQVARLNNCDVTIDELASYFETFVHIPKKMSSMAEMMYT